MLDVPDSLKRKVYAYITHGRRLLVFRHPDSPEAGIQVPGGTIEPGEAPSAAVLREAREETGLPKLIVIGFLGEARRDMSDFPLDFSLGEVHHRRFYHLLCGGEPPTCWRHYERFASGDNNPLIALDFFWASLPDETPELIADQGMFIPRLISYLKD